MNPTLWDRLGAAGFPPSQPAATRRLDWTVLTTRLAAAAACRDAIAANPASNESASFDPAAARRLTRLARKGTAFLRERDETMSSCDVNPFDSVEIKSGAAIDLGTAGALMTGDRGLQ